MAHYEHINSKKYICWTVSEFLEEMRLFHTNRTMEFAMQLGVHSMERQFVQGLPPLNIEDVVRQIQNQEDGDVYRMFREHNAVGGDDFFQEIHTGLSMIDFSQPATVQCICFPVKNNCPDGILLHLSDMDGYRETNSEYDFLIKKDDVYIKYQLKSAPEKYIQEFNAEYFINDIIKQVARYNDEEMVLLYLLQPSIDRDAEGNFYEIFEKIAKGLDKELKIKEVLFVARPTLQIFEYVEVFPELNRTKIDTNNSLKEELRKKPARLT